MMTQLSMLPDRVKTAENDFGVVFSGILSVTAQPAWPGRIQVIGDGTHHLYASNLASLTEKGFRHENTGWTIETSERIGLTGGQLTGVDRALIEDDMGPHDTLFLVDDGMAPIVDVLNDEVVTQLELR